MTANSKIEWTTHTFNPWSASGLRVSPKLRLVSKRMAPDAKGDPIPHVEAQRGKVGERPDVMGVEIAPGVIATVRARKLIAAENVIPPSFQFDGKPQSSALDATTINISGRVLAAGCPFTGSFADLLPGFERVLRAEPIAGASLRRRSHSFSAFLRHSGAT